MLGVIDMAVAIITQPAASRSDHDLPLDSWNSRVT